MKLYGSYSELEDHYIVWKVVGFNTDFGEFFPVKTLHSRGAAEELTGKLNVEDHGSGTNQEIMQEFSKYLGAKKTTPKVPYTFKSEAPILPKGVKCICKGIIHQLYCPYFVTHMQQEPVPQADGDCDHKQTTRFPVQTPLDNPPDAKWYSLDQLFPNDTIHNPLYGNQLCSCESPDDRYGCHYCYTCGLNTAL